MSIGGRLKVAWIATLFVIPVLLVYPVQALLVAFRLRGSHQIPMRMWRYLLWLIGARVSVKGEPARERPLLLCSNHVSWLDIPVLGSLFPLAFIAKSDIAAWPLIGHLSRLQHTIFIDRTRKAATSDANREIADRLAEGGALVLFAEGTTGDGNHVLAFRSSLLGGVRDAIRRADTADVITVQPVAIVYRGHRGLPMPRAHRPRYAWYGDMTLAGHLGPVLSDGVIDIDVMFGQPITFAEGTDRKAVTRALEDEVKRMVSASLAGRAVDGIS